MKIGFFAVGIGHLSRPDMVKTVAVNAERLNFATVWAPEHVVLLDQHISKYPYSKGEFPLPADTPFADPFTTLAYAAAYTTRVKLVTGICLVPEHNPVVLAKVTATLDQLSGGRFTLGVGVGWCGFNLTPAEAADKLKSLDHLLKAAGRKRSDIYMALSPYTKPITRDDLKRYHDLGVDEIGLIEFAPPATERELVAKMEQIAREWVEPASKI